MNQVNFIPTGMERARDLNVPQVGLGQLLDTSPEFVNLLPVAAYACDASGRVLWFNRLAEALWGRAPRLGDDTERFCGSYKLYFGGREISRDETPMAHALRTGEPVHGAEGIVERPDGSRVWAIVHIAPVKDNAGRVIGAVNCFHDTTELHRTTAELRETQQQLSDFFENGAVGLHLVGSDGKILRANKAELQLLGYDAAEYIGHNIRDFHADEATIADILARLSRGEKLDRYPARLKAKDGTIKHVQITSSVNFCDGRFINTRCVTVDVTGEVLAKQKVVESDERFRQLLESLPAAVYTTDAEGCITYYNKAAADMAGRVPEVGSDKWCVTWRLYRSDGTPLPHDECPMAVALKENRPIRNVEALAERPDGTLVPFIPYPTPLRNADGGLVGAVNMLVDISERKQAEAHQMMLLKELNHRVKNNMQMLQALLSAAQRETTDLQARVLLGDATRRVAAMAAAQQVLYEEGKPTSFQSNDFIEAVCAAARSAFDRNVRIKIDAAGGSLSNDVAMPLALILNELLTNAVKHGINGHGGGTIRVAFRPEASGGYELQVEDDGPGFELATAVSRRSSGLGLVSGLARQIGGTFHVERGSGARCVVRFVERRTALQ
jgi:PAS domain S-box-containing protein